jgi:hypothetical protein
LKSTILLITGSNIHDKLRSLKLSVWIIRDLLLICCAVAGGRRVIMIILVHRTVAVASHRVLSSVASSSCDCVASRPTVFAFYAA